jgi:hypothetical protein
MQSQSRRKWDGVYARDAYGTLKSHGHITDGPVCWNRRITRRDGVCALWLKNPPAIT